MPYDPARIAEKRACLQNAVDDIEIATQPAEAPEEHFLPPRFFTASQRPKKAQ
jgi:hypothetical protein